MTELESLRAENAQIRAAKDGAYSERNQCVALLARMALALGWRAGVGQHPSEDKEWEPDWRTIVFIDLPNGQVSWHFHDTERPLLMNLPPYPGAWDGHTTPQKYSRVAGVLDGDLRRLRSVLEQAREAIGTIDARFRRVLARQPHYPSAEEERALDLAVTALSAIEAERGEEGQKP